MNMHVSNKLFGAGGKKRGPSEAKNSLLSRQEARFIDVLGEGPIVGLVDGAKSIFLSGVPHQNSNGTFNHSGFNWEERKGEFDQEASVLVDSTESEHPVNIEVTKRSGPVVQAVQEDNLDGFRVRIRIPQLMQVKDNGEIVPSQVSLAIEWAMAGSGDWHHIFGSPTTITGKNNSPYYRDFEFMPPVPGPWQIRVTRLSDDDDDAKNSSAFYFDAWVGIISQKFIYPNTAYVAFNVDAEQFGSQIPERTYDVKGRIIRVPSNFDGEARTYSGFWDGSWKLAWTNCPAWCFFDLATNRQYGAGYPDNDIDIAALYEISKYSAELIPDGYGGLRHRYSLDVTINTREDAYSLFKKMITTFRGMMYWAGGKVTLTQDAPKPVKFIATPANTENGAFVYRSTADESRVNTVYVTYNNPADGDKPDIEIAEYPEAVRKQGLRMSEVQAWGCRVQGQANALGQWMLYTLHYNTEIVSYVAGPDHDAIYPGDIIAVHDPAKTATKKSSGRVKLQISANRFRLDRELRSDIEAGFQFVVSNNAKKLIYAKISSISVDRREVTLATDIEGGVDPNHIWAIYADDTRLREYSVTSVRPRGAKRSVTALAYNRTKFDFVERGVALEQPPKEPIPVGELRGPRYFDYSVYRVEQQGTANIVRLLVSWTAPEDEQRIAFYRLQYAVQEMTDPNWETVYEGRDTSFTFENLDPTVPVAVRIQSVGVDGNQISAWQTITNIELSSRAVPPAGPSQLVAEAERLGLAIIVTWDLPNKPSDFQTVEIYRSKTDNPNQAVYIGNSPNNTFRDSNLEATTFYYYWVRVVVMTDNPSARYSPMVGPAFAAALPMPETDVLDGSVTSQKLADAAVIGSKLADGSVSNGKIASGSIYGDVIAAGAITAREMVLTDYSNVIPDAALEGGTWWLKSEYDTEIVVTSAFSLGAKAIEYESFTSSGWDMFANSETLFPIASGEKYRLQFESKSDAPRQLWFRLGYYDENKVRLTGADGYSSVINTGVLQGGAAITRHSGSAEVPEGACYARIEIFANGLSAGTGKVTVGGFYAQKQNAASLIVDGSVTADHLGANSVTAGKIAAGSVSADKMSVGELSAITSNVGTLRSGLILDNGSGTRMRIELNTPRILIGDA